MAHLHHVAIVVSVTANQEQVEEEAKRKACFIVRTNVLDPTVLSDQELVRMYKDQGGVERGFLKDPLLQASSVFVKKPERIVALNLTMLFCLSVYRFAEYRLRALPVETKQTISDQVHKPTTRQTMRWIFQ